MGKNRIAGIQLRKLGQPITPPSDSLLLRRGIDCSAASIRTSETLDFKPSQPYTQPASETEARILSLRGSFF